ncbi:MAG: translation initiation factor IF-2 N-terminal domain-containing protein, partial [Candidatus Obscuribacterales bacterium]|nr:translation initiation factor IF-2 N-terminal domain-containing protein [Candidatus Obscuribacterales bacterium]
MDDRVRIYELARKMNIPNQDIINVLRELGYDVKSHSSTIDKTAVTAIIAALGKKNQAAEAQQKDKKVVAKASSKVPPLPEKKVQAVKPRVLSRYRKPDPAAEGEGAETGGAPSAPQNQSIMGAPVERPSILPAGGPAPLPASQISSTPRHPRPHQPVQGELPPATTRPAGPEQAPAQAPKPPVQATPAQAAPPVTQPVHPIVEEPVEEPQGEVAPERIVAEANADGEEEASPAPQGDSWSDESKYAPRAIRNLDKHFSDKQRKQEQSGKSKKRQDQNEPIDTNEEEEAEAEELEPATTEPEYPPGDTAGDDSGDAEPLKKGAMRPMSPSVPIRVAAPSMRATPPPPPHNNNPPNPAPPPPKNEEEERKK